METMENAVTKWRRVSRHEPCPICNKSDYCTRTTDGTAVKCMRVESSQAVETGGWVHSLSNPLPPLTPPRPIKRQADWTAECRAMFGHELAHDMRCSLADKLGVSVESLEEMRIGYGKDEWNGAEFSAWPSRDADGVCIGFIRRYADGSKRTNLGGSVGLFYTGGWSRHPGPVWIVEGGSDVAACESAGLCAIGRGSNTHGGESIKKMLHRDCPTKRVIVVGERDEAPERRGTVPSCTINCRGCSFCWPGLYGAKKVSGDIGAQWVLVPRPYKDMRELLSAGGLWLDLMELI